MVRRNQKSKRRTAGETEMTNPNEITMTTEIQEAGYLVDSDGLVRWLADVFRGGWMQTNDVTPEMAAAMVESNRANVAVNKAKAEHRASELIISKAEWQAGIWYSRWLDCDTALGAAESLAAHWQSDKKNYGDKDAKRPDRKERLAAARKFGKQTEAMLTDLRNETALALDTRDYWQTELRNATARQPELRAALDTAERRYRKAEECKDAIRQREAVDH